MVGTPCGIGTRVGVGWGVSGGASRQIRNAVAGSGLHPARSDGAATDVRQGAGGRRAFGGTATKAGKVGTTVQQGTDCCAGLDRRLPDRNGNGGRRVKMR